MVFMIEINFFFSFISNTFCIPITFNYPFKVSFSNKKYTAQIVKLVLIEILKYLVSKNQLPIRFGTCSPSTNL